MRLLFFMLGMTGFIAAGMLHLPLVGVLGFVLAVVALFLASPREPANHDVNSARANVPETRVPGAMLQSTAGDLVSASPRTSRRLARHGARHQTRHTLPTHTLRQHRRATQKEK